ncbi:DUF4349 domain-containing protein [Streptomyces sp. NPDC004838]
MRARRAFAALVIAASLALALAGCGAGDSSDSDTKAATREEAAVQDPGTGPGSGRNDTDGNDTDGSDGAATDEKTAGAPPSTGPDGAGGSQRKSSVSPSHVIRTAELSVEVKDAEKALTSAREAAEKAGGHVADETTEYLDTTGDESPMTSRIVLRVPQERYAEVLAELAKGGKLLSRKADAEDVTDQVVDVQSRIATQRASVARVRELMDRADKLSDVVTLESELSKRQAELESLLAQQASLKDRTALSTITLKLSEPEAGNEKKEKDDDPGFLDALGGGWDALTATVRWIGIVFGAVFPFAVVLGALYAVWRWLIRPRFAKRDVAGGAEGAPAAPGPLPVYGSPAPAPAPAAAAGPASGSSAEPEPGRE